ncbi:MAG TPA: antibiotic biosynthesis monooxygenase [Blastocatellia bacterium]|nr:antibiotic biosynthesis monooxygenase [Blastocatellia bacterium]
MPLISVTRLRVRSLFYLPQFGWQALATARQAERAPGFMCGRLVREARNTFWTVTAWKDAAAMKAYRDSGAHRKVMPRLLKWCDEASTVHWEQGGAALPTWAEAHRRMEAEGRPSKVSNPSEAHQTRQIAEPRLTGREGKELKTSRQRS